MPLLSLILISHWQTHIDITDYFSRWHFITTLFHYFISLASYIIFSLASLIQPFQLSHYTYWLIVWFLSIFSSFHLYFFYSALSSFSFRLFLRYFFHSHWHSYSHFSHWLLITLLADIFTLIWLNIDRLRHYCIFSIFSHFHFSSFFDIDMFSFIFIAFIRFQIDFITLLAF
jgi:hypothetical protein